jgi:heat shock 70kDa protein 1/2/6/8
MREVNKNNIFISFMSKYIIGIDLGTTNSAVAVYKKIDNSVEVITNEDGFRTTPSCVSFIENDDNNIEIFVGNYAKEQLKKNPKNTIVGVKRFIGRNFNDPIVKKDRIHFQYLIEDDGNNKPTININNKKYYPEDISSIILKKMKTIAENYLSCEINDAVITVPAYFTDSQRQSTKDAGLMAGLNVKRIINEPTAAALAYGLHKTHNEQTILVFDLGGGTFDTTVLHLSNGVFEVKSTGGDTHLGGDDFDNHLVKHCLTQFLTKYKLNENEIKTFLSNKKSQQKLRIACEKAKTELSFMSNTNIEIENLYEDYELSLKISKSKFEDLCLNEFNKCMNCVKQVLIDANLNENQIDKVVLVGGSTRIPRIRELLSDFFGDYKLCFDVNPDEAVAFGAAIQGELLNENNNPHFNDIVLLDVIPLSIGIETADGSFYRLIEKNTTIPIRKKYVFSTQSDNQPEVKIKIYEGEREIAKLNNLLGEFCLNGITPSPKGIPHIEVMCEISVDGIISIHATEYINIDNNEYVKMGLIHSLNDYVGEEIEHEKKEGQTKKIVISNYRNRLTEEYIKQKIIEAKNNEIHDLKYKKAMETKMDYLNYLYDVQNVFTDETIRNKLSEVELKEVFETIKNEIKWIQTNDMLDEIDYRNKYKKIKNYFLEINSRVFSEE